MSLRFLADYCIPNLVMRKLEEAGHEVFRLKNYIAKDSPDPVVISTAQELDAILISLDGDFADIVTYPPSDYKGIISLQIRNHPEVIPKLMERLKDYISIQADMAHYKGKLIIVETHRIRIRE